MTSGLLSEALAPLRADPHRAAILFDIDGTLAPIVERAGDAQVPHATRQLLDAVARRYGTVACVSGRQAAGARAMVAVDALSYIGSHGAELLRPGWSEARLDPAVENWARRIHEFGRHADTDGLRRRQVRMEDKGPIIAFHWRGAADEQEARAAVDALAARAKEASLHTHWGRKVLEVRPPVPISKGAGIRSFLEHTDVDRALYAGDDLTDVDAFRALDALVGEGVLAHAVKVGVESDEGPEAVTAEADVVVDGTDGVIELLAALVAE